VGSVAADDDAELLEAELQHVGAVDDRGVAERFEEVALPGPRGPQITRFSWLVTHSGDGCLSPGYSPSAGASKSRQT